MEKEYEKNIKPILDTFDSIREILRFEAIELPKIVVVGDQSSGKSSVLESVTGVCLPRGENTVTKCPIVLQMRNVAIPSEEYATVRIEGDHNDSPKYPLKDLNDKIRATQEELIKRDKTEISDKPIYVYVRKLGAPDLTLYDLPGLNYKNENALEIIRKIILKYTEGKETLILLVLPANNDLTNTEAISLIRKYNDHKQRTIAIITKIDLVVNEKNLYRKIMNNELELKFDPVVVRNRNQEELEENADFESIRQKEMDLIDTTSDLRKLPDQCKGTSNLIWRLINIQKDFLLKSKIDIKEKILNKLATLRDQRRMLPPPSDTLVEKLDRFKECLDKLTSNFTAFVSGSLVSKDENFEQNIGSRLREKFEHFFVKIQTRHERFFSEEFKDLVFMRMRESRGLSLPNFLDSKGFHSLMNSEISQIQPHVIDFIEDFQEYIAERLLELNKEAFENYPTLRDSIAVELKNSVNSKKEEARILIFELLECEQTIEWTVNPYYMDIYMKITSQIEKKKKDIEQHPLGVENVPSGFSLPIFSKKIENVQTQKIQSETEIEINDIKIKECHLFTPNVLKAHANEDMNNLNIQISCFAYWKVFEKRFVDYCELILLKKLVFYYVKDLGLMLEKKFSPSSSNGEVFISEESSITKKRHAIDASIKNLELAKEKLNQI
jgi:GTP-binding protein EngB required for normal cell division